MLTDLLSFGLYCFMVYVLVYMVTHVIFGL